MKKTKTIQGYEFELYEKQTYDKDEMENVSKIFYEYMNLRRSVRKFSNKSIPRAVIENLVLAASTAPSGAHKQPWTFAIVSNADIKRKIRLAAEKEEYESYSNRMNEEWLKDLKPLQTDWKKPFLEVAPYLIIVLKRVYETGTNNKKKNNYYVNESVGLATGFLLAAIHKAGLVALTHTPSPMNFLTEILERPKNERPIFLIPVGYPAEETYVPKLKRKTLHQVAEFYD